MVFADVLCLRRRRRGDWRVQQPEKEVRRERRPPVQAQPPPTNRGCTKMPLPVTEDTPPDMLAGAMDITVLLPNGRTVNMSVERSTPMMDLLVQLTTAHKLSLAGHTTVALSDSGYPLHHLPSTPLGALDTRLIQVAQRANTLKKAPPRPNNTQPFTTTFRLQVHLPRNQLFVTRVSPDTKLSDILHLACKEKNLDPTKYELRHPANLCECLSLSHTLADYRLQEVTLVASRPPGAPLTPADIMALQREEEKRRQQVKKTGGIYNIIFNKRSKSTPEGSGSVSSDSLNGRSISPARSDESIERSVSPPTSAPPQRPGRKRRPAPKPPVSTPVSVQNKETGVDNNKEGSTTLSHSRTSSDSSGYHEASVLSESPDTRTNSSAETLPRRSKLPSTSNIITKSKCSTLQHGTSKSGNHNLSRSLSNLTAVGINAQNKHSASTSSLASQGLSRKKKAAPPPPVAPVKMVDTQEPIKEENIQPNEVSKPTEIVAALLHDIKTFDEKSVMPNQVDSSEEKITPPEPEKNLIKQVQAVPKLDDILDEECLVLDLTTTKRNSVAKLESVEQTSIESVPSSVEESSASVDACRVDKPATPIASPDLVTSAIIHTPPPAAQDDSEVPLEAVLRDDLGGGVSPEMEEVPDWQYHLPAPPSAFRDLHSPTTTEFGTVVLADASVFQEASPENKSKDVENKNRVSTTDVEKSLAKSVERSSNVVDNISLDNESTTSLANGHSSLSSRSSLDSNEESSRSKRDVKGSVIPPETDWEPQTITVAESTKKTKSVVINGDLRLRQDGVKEVYKVNPLFNNEIFEEDMLKKEQNAMAKVQLEENENYRNKNSINRGSNTDLQLSSHLKNFTISTYNTPQSVDNIFSEDQSSESETVFKKPLAPSKFPLVSRTNSYSSSDKDRPATSVKRSTSYVSLARPYTKPTTFQSISRTKSISSLVKDDDTDSSRLRKSTSDANIHRVDDFPLQSLQVLKSILPRLSQSQILNETGDLSQETSKPLTITQINPQVEKPVPQPPADVQNEVVEAAPPPPPAPEVKPIEVPKSEPRSFVYRGPPAINFSTWSERPKVQVSLKSDRDYRMGNHMSTTNANGLQSNAQQTSRENSNSNKNTNAINNSITTNVSKVVSETKSVVKNTEEPSKKIEPTPLTLRIVSHTTSSPRNKTSLREDVDQNIIVSKPEKTTKIDFQQVDRLPIVRAVELKKSRPESFVQMRNSSTTHLNGSSNVAHVPVSYNQPNLYNRHSYIERGPVLTNSSPSLTKSISTSQINTEAPENGFSHTKILANGGKKYTSVIGINGPGVESDKVIQNSASFSNVQTTSQVPRSQSVRQNFSTVKVNGFSSGGGKPMPIVKGFRMAGTDAANYDRGPVKISIEAERPDILPHKHTSKTNITNGVHINSTPVKQPLKTINGVENMRTKSSSGVHVSKVQRNSSIILDQTDGKFTNKIPEPPKLPTVAQFKKPTPRPVSAFSNPRDELMHAIKNFGGRESLKPAKPKPNTNVILSI